MECKTCHKEFEDYKKLALHLKIDHHSRSKWASAVLTDVQRLDRKVSLKSQGHTPYTEQDKDNRESCIREDISGKTKITTCYCSLCNRRHMQNLPIEFSENPLTWRVKEMVVVSCENCSRKSRRF